MGKGICRTYKNGQRNWPYPYPDTTFVLPQPPDTSIKTQFTSDSDVSVGAHTLSSPVSYQSTIPHGNNDVNNNDDALSFETPREKSRSYSCFDETITTTTTPNSSKLPPPGKGYLIFQTEGKIVRAAQCDKSRALIRFMKIIFEIGWFEQICVIIKGLM